MSILKYSSSSSSNDDVVIDNEVEKENRLEKKWENPQVFYDSKCLCVLLIALNGSSTNCTSWLMTVQMICLKMKVGGEADKLLQKKKVETSNITTTITKTTTLLGRNSDTFGGYENCKRSVIFEIKKVPQVAEDKWPCCDTRWWWRCCTAVSLQG